MNDRVARDRSRHRTAGREPLGRGRLWRSRWAAVGAAIAVTLGAGGLVSVRAASSVSTFVPVEPQRVLDTRFGVGLSGAMTSGRTRVLDVAGSIPIVLPGNSRGTAVVVPDGATAIVANITSVRSTSTGYVTVRPGDATGEPTTSSVNITTPGGTFPNSVTVALPTNGTIGLYFFANQAGGTTHLLLDIVGYYVAGSGSGVPGPQGPQGPTGPQGPAAWEDIPSGTVLTGPINFDSQQAADNSSDEFHIPFGGIAPVALTDGKVNFAPPSDAGSAFGDQDSTCTGTVNNPTAPAGKVCVYIAYAGGVNRSSTSGWAPFYQADTGFNIGIVPAGDPGADMYLFGSWAYTAP